MEETSFHNDRGKKEDSSPDVGQASSLPKDAQVIVAILKDMGVTDYEPRVVNQLLEFTYKYVTDVLEDAKTYSNHAGNNNVTKEDVKFAVQMKLDHSFTSPPPREFLVELAQQKNHAPLPTLKSYTGARLPPDRYCLTSINYRLKPQVKLQKKNQQRNSQLLTSNKGAMSSLNGPGVVSQGFRTVVNPQMVIPGSGASKRKWQDVDDYDT